MFKVGDKVKVICENDEIFGKHRIDIGTIGEVKDYHQHLCEVEFSTPRLGGAFSSFRTKIQTRNLEFVESKKENKKPHKNVYISIKYGRFLVQDLDGIKLFKTDSFEELAQFLKDNLYV